MRRKSLSNTAYVLNFECTTQLLAFTSFTFQYVYSMSIYYNIAHLTYFRTEYFYTFIIVGSYGTFSLRPFCFIKSKTHVIIPTSSWYNLS